MDEVLVCVNKTVAKSVYDDEVCAASDLQATDPGQCAKADYISCTTSDDFNMCIKSVGSRNTQISLPEIIHASVDSMHSISVEIKWP